MAVADDDALMPQVEGYLEAAELPALTEMQAKGLRAAMPYIKSEREDLPATH